MLPTYPRCSGPLFRTNPNRKGMERATLRLRTCPGVTRAAVAANGRGLTVIARSVQDVESRVDGETAFAKPPWSYLRIGTRMRAGGLCFRLSAVSVCRHAIERLVERADVPANGTLLARVDAEARGIFGGWDRGTHITDDGDEFYPAATPVSGQVAMTGWRSTPTGALRRVTCRSFRCAHSCRSHRCGRRSGCAGAMIRHAGCCSGNGRRCSAEDKAEGRAGMSDFRFLHSSDLHLGRPFGGYPKASATGCARRATVPSAGLPLRPVAAAALWCCWQATPSTPKPPPPTRCGRPCGQWPTRQT